MRFTHWSFFKNGDAAAHATQKSAPSSDPITSGPIEPAHGPASTIEPATESAPQEKHMNSIFQKIEGAEKSTVAWIEKQLTAIEGKEPGIAKVIDTSLTYIAPVLQIALGATGDPAAALIVGQVATQAETDLKVASALVTDFGPTPTAATAFASVSTNLSGLLTAGHVKSATAVAAVTKAVSEVGVIVTAVQTAATAIAASVPVAA
jgi:hypothetical protein